MKKKNAEQENCLLGRNRNLDACKPGECQWCGWDRQVAQERRKALERGAFRENAKGLKYLDFPRRPKEEPADHEE